jgi:hypothetical protein
MFHCLILQNFNLKIEDSILTGMRDSHTDFNATLQCFQVDTQFCPLSISVVEVEGKKSGFHTTFTRI